ncbi:MAG: TolC family protein [Bacteroides sp.]|nr:TolC family protein [Bacteroides sp.]
MKARILLLSIGLVSGLFLGKANAQERWSLRRCIDHAIAHNINIRQTANAAEQSAVEAHTAKWARLPNLNASASQGWNWGRAQTAVKNEDTGDYSTVYVNTSSNNTNLTLGTSIPLFTGLQIPNQQALAKLNLKAAVADLEKAKQDIAINIASAYLQVLFNQELHQVAVTQVELSRQQLARIERLAQLGKASPAEVAESKARVAQDEMQAVQADNNRRIALLDLSQLIELESPEGFLLENPDTRLVLAPLTPPEEIYQTALVSKPSIQAAQYRLEGSKHSIRLAQSSFYPQLTLNGSLGTSYYSTIDRTFSQQMHDNFNKYVGLNLSIPLFNRFSTRNRVRTARLQRENYALQLDAAKKTLYKEIQQAWYNALAAESQYTSSSSAALASQESFRLMSEKYDNGKATAVEYNEAKQNLMKAQSDELQAKYEYLFRTKILAFYKGEEIK